MSLRNPAATRPSFFGHAAFLAALLAALLTCWLAAPVSAQARSAADQGAAEAPAGADTAAPAASAGRLPAPRTTDHEVALPDRTLAFRARAGAITLTDDDGTPEADIGFVEYTLKDADPDARPVTFAVNGGPGAASAYLHLGVLGPWILPMDDESIVPSQPVDLVPNPDTWLDFTDLVFIDPVGTGFSRLVDPGDRLRDRYLSIDGDVSALAEFVRRWLTETGRIGSPRYFVGESYGGFRGPLLAEALQTKHGLALQGMVLLSPVLDFGWWQQPDHAPLPSVSLLPSLAAAAMEEDGAFSEAALGEAEAYAEGAYIADLLRGVRDEAAVGRIVDRVSEITGLDRAFVDRAAGRIGRDAFAREFLRDEGRLASPYDTTIAAADPFPASRRARAGDPVLDAMTAPLTGAMLAHYRATLDWLPERRYRLLNGGVNRAWDWESGRGQPEAVGALARVMALDPAFRTLVVHGYTDLVTPYFATELILRQIPVPDADARLRSATYRGGHMFYLRPGSRRAFREDAQALYEGGPM
jgi:carboxypeptidase C (cathepsin A)